MYSATCLYPSHVRTINVQCNMFVHLYRHVQYTFLIYRLESLIFLCTVHISDVPSGKCSVSVHSTHFWCTLWDVFCFCAQYTLLMYPLESVLFLCTVHISDAKLCDNSLSNRLVLSVTKGFVLFALFVVILPRWWQFQSLSKHAIALLFLMNVTNTKHSPYIGPKSAVWRKELNFLTGVDI